MKRGGVAAVCLAALCALGALTLGAYARRGRAAENVAEAVVSTATPGAADAPGAQGLVFDGQGVFHLLLIGVDETDEYETQRSDCMLLLSVDRERKRLVLTSFMRDIYCEIPGHGASRLNHAYMWGGASLLRQTLAENFEIAPDGYVLVGLEGFQTAVDTVGGVALELTEEEAARFALEVGENRLDGQTALEYARSRDIGNADYDRTARQRRVVAALFEQVRALSARELVALAGRLWPQVETDLTFAQLAALAAEAVDFRAYEPVELRIPVDGTITDRVVDGMMVLDIDLEANRRAWRAAVYGDENGAAG